MYKHHEATRLVAEGRWPEARDVLVAALRETSGNQVHAAAALGTTDRTMRRWIARLREQGIDVVALAADAPPEAPAEPGKKKRKRAA